ncbi:MAG TPA: siderophore-interacting protein [Caulobacteraceae bacterium]|jgi:NADPH-dependent ferric siderophore reductase|nr:siderophore-interacting protein [Caulobacteraceae bacterium]
MSDVSEPFRRPGLPFGLGAIMGRPPMRAWSLVVTGRTQVTPRMLRVSFSAPDLAAQPWRPGQDLVIQLPQPDGSVARRHYTIRDVDRAAGRIDIDFVLHGSSPAGDWARAARGGEVIEAHGPRGRTALAADVDHHLFLGDETCIPGIFAMAESMPAGAKGTALIEIADMDEAQTLSTPADVTVEWVSRNDGAPGPGNLLLDRLSALKPSANGTHAYVIGETSNVRNQRHHLLANGFDKARITAEGYWRPGRVGGHDHV